MHYKLPNLRGGRIIGPNGLDLNPGNHESQTYPVEGWHWFDSPLDAIAEIGWEPPEEMILDEYDPNDPLQLKVYGLPNFPADVAQRYTKYSPPESFHWKVLGLTYAIQCDHSDRGFKSRKVYVDRSSTPFFGLVYTHSGVTVEGRSALQVTEQAIWILNNGSELLGKVKEPKILHTDSQAWIDYMESCRATIYRNFKLWVPAALIAINETEETEGDPALLESRMKASAWLEGDVGLGIDFYVKNGDPRPLFAAMAADTTPWLDIPIPDGTVPGLASGKTVREMILEGLR